MSLLIPCGTKKDNEKVNWRWLSSGLLCHVVWYKCTNISEVLAASETSVNFYQTTWHNNAEDNHPHTHHHENLKSHKKVCFHSRDVGKYLAMWQFRYFEKCIRVNTDTKLVLVPISAYFTIILTNLIWLFHTLITL
jgi:hypothetical protein